MPNKIIYYKKANKAFARKLRNDSTYAEVLLWKYIRNRSLGAQFHRQVPLDEFIANSSITKSKLHFACKV